MKKFLTILVILALLAGGGYAAYLYLQKAPGAGAEGILPEGAVCYWEMNDLEGNLGGLTETELWKAVTAIDYAGVLLKAGAEEKDVKVLRDVQSQISLYATQRLVARFFGRQFAIAVYPADLENVTSFEQLVDLLKNISFVTRVPPEIQLSEFFTGFFDQFGEDISHTTTTYLDKTIHILKDNKGMLDIGYVHIGGYLVFGVGETAARQAIDVAAGERPPLKDDPRYVESASKILSGAEMFSYFDFGTFMETLETLALKDARGFTEEQKERFQKSFKGMKGFKTIVYSATYANLSKAKMDMYYDRSRIDPDLLALYQCSSVENRSLNFTPASAVWYQWNTCQKYDYYWKELMKEAKDMPPENAASFREAVANAEEMLGMSIEKDVIPAFGEELGLIVTGVQTGGLFPVPQIAMFVKAVDPGKIKQIIAKLTDEQTVFLIQPETYKGTEIHYVIVPLASNLEPAYSFFDGYFMITSNRQMIKDAVDALAGASPSLGPDPGFKQVDFGLSGKNASVGFFRVDGLFRIASGLLEWMAQWGDAQVGRQQAFAAGIDQRLAQVRAEIDELTEKMKSLEIQKEAASGDPAVQDQIDETQLALDAAWEMRQEMEDFQDNYKKQVRTIEQQKIVTDELIQPLLKAFQSIGVLGSRTNFNDGVIESEMSWTMK